eukprot:jgi/Orpsp1_1/1187315/evm.model.d7180000056836.1
MSAVKFKHVCEIHNKTIFNVCLNKECNNRFLCRECFRCHDITHSINYVPICELIDGENNIIIFNEYINAHSEDGNKFMMKKQELLNEMYIGIEELKKNLENKINKQFDELKPISEDLKEVNNLSLDEISRPNYVINDTGTIATKIGDKNNWNCTVIGNKEIPLNKISKWKIKLNEIQERRNNILIGIGPENINNEENYYDKCLSFICEDSTLCLKDATHINYNNHSGRLKKNDIIEVTVDRIKGTLSFAVNGIDYGIAYSGIPSTEKLYPIVLITYTNQTVELLN